MEDNKHELMSQTYKTLLKMAGIIQSGYGKPGLDAKSSLETAKTLLTITKKTRFDKKTGFDMPYILVVGEVAAHFFAAEPGNETKADAAVTKAINLVCIALEKECKEWADDFVAHEVGA